MSVSGMIYCISDLHGCYDEFIALLEKIKFSPRDTLYILGDAIDRGKNPIGCVNFIMKEKNIHFIMGNHEQMMMEFYEYNDFAGMWLYNGGKATMNQFKKLAKTGRDKIFAFLRNRSYYKTVEVNGKKYFLSHAGLDADVPFERQEQDALIWGREEFYRHKALEEYTCIFGHTPTRFIRNSDDCSVWFDENHNDKICIDCGCVYGGMLAALRLNDGEIFYVNSNKGKR